MKSCVSEGGTPPKHWPLSCDAKYAFSPSTCLGKILMILADPPLLTCSLSYEAKTRVGSIGWCMPLARTLARGGQGAGRPTEPCCFLPGYHLLALSDLDFLTCVKYNQGHGSREEHELIICLPLVRHEVCRGVSSPAGVQDPTRRAHPWLLQQEAGGRNPAQSDSATADV